MNDLLPKMASSLAHRGPDHQGIYASGDRRVGLAHRRLSIVDLTDAGNQPMRFERDGPTIVFNGEIFNYLELRARLEAQGSRFATHSDTEVILHLYRRYGMNLTEHLHGMFAFAIWDEEADRMFCARDRLGKKPFVYSETERGFVFASEIPAVLQAPWTDRALDPVAAGIYLLRNFRHIPDPLTLYQKIRRLPAGHSMVVEGGRVSRVWRYWNPTYEMKDVNPEEVLETFDRAVDLRMVADLEVAALLSGGVDSTAVVQRMVKRASYPVKTYALGLNAQDEELKRARGAAGMLGTQHKEFYFDPDIQHDHLVRLLKAYGEPIVLLPLLFTYDLCRQIRDDGIKVVMAGHGADEIFYGYTSNNSQALLSMLMGATYALPGLPAIARAVSGVISRLAPPSRLRDAAIIASRPAGKRKLGLYLAETRSDLSSLVSSDIVQGVEKSLEDIFSTWASGDPREPYIDEANRIGLMHENAHSVTIAGDLPAMAASVEVRCPFLDQDLVQLAWRTRYRKKVKKLFDPRFNKGILKESLEGRLPSDLLYASKRGFGFYIQERDVLQGPWKERVLSTLTGRGLETLFSPAQIRKIRDDFYSGSPAVSASLVAKLYVLNLERSLAA